MRLPYPPFLQTVIISSQVFLVKKMAFKSKLLLSAIMFITGWSISGLSRQYPGYIGNPNNSMTDRTEFLQQFAYRKEIPEEIEYPVLQALSHYPELRDVRIKFITKEQYATLTTCPSSGSMVMPRGHREYIITISNKTIPVLTPFAFSKSSGKCPSGYYWTRTGACS
jgi:hypothetical protein